MTGKLITMRLRQPGSVDHAIEALTIVMNQLYDCQMGNTYLIQEKWLKWWEMADAQLRSLFAESDALTDLYQTRLEMGGTTDAISPLPCARQTCGSPGSRR